MILKQLLQQLELSLHVDRNSELEITSLRVWCIENYEIHFTVYDFFFCNIRSERRFDNFQLWRSIGKMFGIARCLPFCWFFARSCCGRRKSMSGLPSVGWCFRECWPVSQVRKHKDPRRVWELVSRRFWNAFQVQGGGHRGLTRVIGLAHLIREDSPVTWQFLNARRWPRSVSRLGFGPRRIPLVCPIHPRKSCKFRSEYPTKGVGSVRRNRRLPIREAWDYESISKW